MLSYRPVEQHRYFYPGTRYDAITWSNFAEAVKAFHRKISDWYIAPAEVIHKAGFDHAFALMALTCQLTDTLSQYYFGTTKSSQKTFKDFLTEVLTPFDTLLPQPIKYINPKGQLDQLKTFADVFYVGFRCGILHECHVPLYGGLAGQDQLQGRMFDIDPEVCTKYDDGTDCPTVRMDPTVIYPAVKAVFETYTKNLVDGDQQFDPLRASFKNKFFASFGVNPG